MVEFYAQTIIASFDFLSRLPSTSCTLHGGVPESVRRVEHIKRRLAGEPLPVIATNLNITYCEQLSATKTIQRIPQGGVVMTRTLAIDVQSHAKISSG